MAEIDEPVHLSPYNPEWPNLFSAEAQRIIPALPTEVAIEHIGSTSVTGLLAKPIIDIMVGTEAQHVDQVRRRLRSLGMRTWARRVSLDAYTSAGEQSMLSTFISSVITDGSGKAISR